MNIYNQLREKGFRITSQRMAIIEAIAHNPQTVQEIAKEVKNVDIASIYRTLGVLENINLVQEIEFGDGKKRYELKTAAGHHHHLVCDSCGKIEDIHIPQESQILFHIGKKNNFKVNRHLLEVFGLCSHCQ